MTADDRLEDDGMSVEDASPHTEMKLSVVSRYIGYIPPTGSRGAGLGGGFLRATQGAIYRRYIDAFAGLGRYRFEGGRLRDGSAMIALRAEVPGPRGRSPIGFTHLRFIELEAPRAEVLRARARVLDPSEVRMRVRQGDSNTLLPELLLEVEDKTPTLALLDPYDLDDLTFDTVRLIGTWHEGLRARRIEQFIGLQIGRVRRQAKIDTAEMPSVKTLNDLAALLGNRRWEPVMRDWVDHKVEWSEVFAAMRDSFEEELHKMGYAYVRHCDVDANDPMYSLVFASDSKDGDKIMGSSIDHWQRDPKLLQGSLL